MLVSFSQINFMTREIGKELLTFTEKDDGERELKDSQSKGLLVVLRRRPRRPVVEVDVVFCALASLINPITWVRPWSFFYPNRNCCQRLTYSTAQSPLWELFWTTKEWLVIHLSFISRLIESLYFICALKNAVGSRSFVRGIVSPTEPHTSHLSFISHMPYLVALESLHHVWKGYHWGCSSKILVLLW